MWYKLNSRSVRLDVTTAGRFLCSWMHPVVDQGKSFSRAGTVGEVREETAVSRVKPLMPLMSSRSIVPFARQTALPVHTSDNTKVSIQRRGLLVYWR
jgi:hypothetical protein